MTARLRALSAHHALFLLKNCLSIPKLLYVLRTSPAWSATAELRDFDEAVRIGLIIVTNNRLQDSSWTQATLPVRQGGLGIRRTAELSFSAYLASVYWVNRLISGILPTFDMEKVIAEPTFRRCETSKVNAPPVEQRTSQKHWEAPVTQRVLQQLLDAAEETDRARLRAVSTPESGVWLEALPSAALGNHLSDDML